MLTASLLLKSSGRRGVESFGVTFSMIVCFTLPPWRLYLYPMMRASLISSQIDHASTKPIHTIVISIRTHVRTMSSSNSHSIFNIQYQFEIGE